MGGNIQCVVTAGRAGPHLWSFAQSEKRLHQHPVLPSSPPRQERNRLIVFAVTAATWCCRFEYVKHSVCQRLTEIQSDHSVGVPAGNPTVVSHICRQFVSNAPFSQALSLQCHQVFTVSEKLSSWSAISCKFVCSSFYSAKLYMLGKPILRRIALKVFPVLIVLNDPDYWADVTDFRRHNFWVLKQNIRP